MGRLRRLVPIGLAVALVCILGLAPRAASAQDAPQLSQDERLIYFARNALDAADARRWSAAGDFAAEAGDPLIDKLVLWINLTDRDTRPGFDALASFITANPDWPLTRTLLEKAERALAGNPRDDAQALAWLSLHPPLTREGRIRLAEALTSAGRAAEADDLLRSIWIEENFSKPEARAFYRLHKDLLRPEDHAARLDRLLWDRRAGEARRMLGLVDPGLAALAEARLRLMERKGGVDPAIAAVPDALKNDPGLQFERLSWRNKKGFDDAAQEILFDPPADLVRPDLWWRERAIQVRTALNDGYISEAYRLASNHGLPPGADYAEAEWLAGWIALSFLGEAQAAFEHFAAMRATVNYPISIARASYWAGRAMEAMENDEAALNWYLDAAAHAHTYYGQLAAVSLHALGAAPPSPAWSEPRAEASALAGGEIGRAALTLAEVGAADYLEPFLLRLVEMAKTAGDVAFSARLALMAGKPELSVKLAKEATQRGLAVVAYAYPLVALPLALGPEAPEEALILAIVRQESAFDANAVSGAGARGLMQLMPATAHHVAKALQLPASPERLNGDPAYNLALGQTYLASLLKAYDGSYVLALAAYNAGPSNVRRWMRQFGDPREAGIDIIDWIELVPFSETRNYIQRVLEGLQVYRQRLGGEGPALLLIHDLERSARPTPGVAG